MALSKRKTTVAVLREILGKYDGREDRFALLAKRSRSWVKKVSAGLIPLSEDTARRLELETGIPRDWLMGPANAIPKNSEGKRYESADFQWHRDGAKAGNPRIRSAGFPFVHALKIAGIGSAAGNDGKASLFLWRLRTFFDECALEFGFDKQARTLAQSILKKALAKTPELNLIFADKGFDVTTLKEKRVLVALKKAAKGKAPGERVEIKLRLPPKGVKKRRKPA